MLNLLKSKRQLRFVLVGVCNAVISFGLLNLLFYKIHLQKIPASLVATSCALLFSFVMNREYVFKDKDQAARQQLPIFILVTISGSVLVLNSVYIISLHLLSGHESLIIGPIQTLTTLKLTGSFVDINLSTVIGAIAAMVWNYHGYKWFVFKGSRHEAAEEVVEHLL